MISKEQYYTEYETTYRPLRVEGKAVVDIGLDYHGSCIDWFLEHGARSVTGFEKDEEILKHLKESYSNDQRVKILGEWTGQFIEGDVLKIDCEGCEQKLDLNYLGRFEQFAVGLHPLWIPEEDNRRLREYMASVGAKLVYDVEKELMFVKV